MDSLSLFLSVLIVIKDKCIFLIIIKMLTKFGNNSRMVIDFSY